MHGYAYQAHGDCADECAPEAGDGDAGHEPGCQGEESSVYDNKEEAAGEAGERDRDDFEEGLDECIEKGEHGGEDGEVAPVIVVADEDLSPKMPIRGRPQATRKTAITITAQRTNSVLTSPPIRGFSGNEAL